MHVAMSPWSGVEHFHLSSGFKKKKITCPSPIYSSDFHLRVNWEKLRRRQAWHRRHRQRHWSRSCTANGSAPAPTRSGSPSTSKVGGIDFSPGAWLCRTNPPIITNCDMIMHVRLPKLPALLVSCVSWTSDVQIRKKNSVVIREIILCVVSQDGTSLFIV